MRIHELKPPIGSKHAKKRVGRGNGSGHGTYSTRGLKGQKARAGGKIRRGFEGGQLPLIKRMPSKRGFTNIFKVEYQIVNVGRLDTFEPDTTVTREALKQVGIIKSLELPVKILGDGQLSRRLTVEADRFSVSAAAKIEAAGGQAVGKIDA